MKAKKGENNMTLKQRLTIISLSLTTLLLYSALISHSNNKNSEVYSYTLEIYENAELINDLISSKDKLSEEFITRGIKGKFLVEKKLELTK